MMNIFSNLICHGHVGKEVSTTVQLHSSPMKVNQVLHSILKHEDLSESGLVAPFLLLVRVVHCYP